ncbi:MAG: hypothetical protein FGF50_01020 [Candidatus Brockarchaeota archaeon]|nr:hypothetical protein [Candidatus Brockarchaeota archaeon]
MKKNLLPKPPSSASLVTQYAFEQARARAKYHFAENIFQVVEGLTEEVKIGVFHFFPDEISPAWEFKGRYGDRIYLLGGVDVDKLARFNGEALRGCVKKILDKCVPGGRCSFGSGDTVTNYVPVQNYLIMLEEGLGCKAKRWITR